MARFENILGLEEIKKELYNAGINVTNTDISIADALMSLSQDTIIRENEDLDGIIVKNTTGFISNNQVIALLKSFPVSAALISKLNRKNNYGFVNEQGEVSRTGVMGDIDPISDVKNMVDAYISDSPRRKKIYLSEDDYERERRAKRNMELEQRLRMRYGDRLGSEMEIGQVQYNNGTVKEEPIYRAQKPETGINDLYDILFTEKTPSSSDSDLYDNFLSMK